MLAVVMMASCNAQKKQPVPEDMKPAFPTAQSVTLKKSLYTVNDANNKLLGYALYSKPASDGVKGFKGETPLLICFDAQKKISQVVMLPNQDTPAFVNRVKNGGLLDTWNGLNAKQAREKQCDVVAGATYTSKGVIESMHKALETL